MKEVKLLTSNLKRIYSIIFFSLFSYNILISQEATLSFGVETVLDDSTSTVEILIENIEDVYGFQFNVTGVNIISSVAGGVVPGDWMLTASSDMLLGFSLMGTYIPVGSGVLVNITYESSGADICLENGVVSGAGGTSLIVGYGDCLGVITSTLEFGLIDQNTGTMEIYINTPVEISSFDFGVSGVYLTGASGGVTGTGWNIATDTLGGVIGQNIIGDPIPSGYNLITILSFSEVNSDETCIDPLSLLWDVDGNELNVGQGECQALILPFTIGCNDSEALNYNPDADGCIEDDPVDFSCCEYEGNQVTLSFGTVNEDSGTMEILMDSSEDVYGFQFDITGVTISNFEAGSIVPSDWMVSASNFRVLGFSLMGTYIPAGSGTLGTLTYEAEEGDICFEEGVMSGADGVSLTVGYGDCVGEGECDDVDADGICDDIDDCVGEYDECGVCNGEGIPEGDCDCEGNVEDCVGECGGLAELDECGVCNGDGIPDGECDCDGNVEDCAGMCGGSAELDECGICEGDNSSCTGCLDPDAENYCEDCMFSCDACCEYGVIDPIITLISPSEGEIIYAAGLEVFLDATINVGDQFSVTVNDDELEGLYSGDNFLIHAIPTDQSLFSQQARIIQIQTVNSDGIPYENPESHTSVNVVFSPPEEFFTDQSTFQAFYFIYEATSEGLPLEYNDWIGAYCNDTCVGNKWWYSDAGPPITVPAFGNDGGLPGFCLPGDSVSFRMYDNSQSTYYDMVPSSVVPEGGWANFNFYTVDSLFSTATDCNGEIGGGAYIDDCGVCADGGTGIVPNEIEECTGPNLDCNCECFGDAIVDECGECDGDGIDEGACDCEGNVEDCAGECGGLAELDDCGVCEGNNAEMDCAGICFGESYEDVCGVCDDNQDNDNDTCSGCTDNAALNCEENSDECESCVDGIPCDGFFDPEALVDDGSCMYNVSVAINEFFYRASLGVDIPDYVELINLTDNDYDLTGWKINDITIPGGLLPSGGFFIIAQLGGFFHDSTGLSLTPGVDLPNSIGVPGFSLSTNDDIIVIYNAEGLFVDSVHYDIDEGWPVGNENRGHALELTDPANDNLLLEFWTSVSDSVISPILYNDDGELLNYGTPLVLNSNYSGGDADCAGVIFGNADLDDCGDCVGGTTGLEENYNMDCTGICDGEAFFDDCGICSSGTSGHEENSDMDCAGTCPEEDGFGAQIDDCEYCCGGNSEYECSYYENDSDFGGVYDCLQNCPDDEGYIGPGSGYEYEENYGSDECGVCQGPNNNCTDSESGCICSGCNDDSLGIAPDIYGCCRDQIWDGTDCIGGTSPNDSGYCESGNGYNSMNYDPEVLINDETCLYFYAEIQSIIDIPNDQGGRVYLTFKRAFFDTDSAYVPRETEGYSIERLDSYFGDTLWVNVASGYAYGENVYIYEVTTLVDSNHVDMGLTNLRVVASMDEGIWISPMGTGYSVDNISPEAPGGLVLSGNDSFYNLEWNSNTETDFQYYNIYSRTLGGEPFWSWINSSSDSEYIIYNIPEITTEYTVTAVDHNGNESDFSDPIATPELNIFDISIPDKFMLYASYPNPFNPVTNINYSIPKGEYVNISIYDVYGNLNTIIFDSYISSGNYNLTWDAGNNASGIYIVSVKAGQEIKTQKILLLK